MVVGLEFRSDPRGEGAGGGRLNCFRGEGVPVSDGSGEEGVLALVGAAVDSGELSVVASSGSGVEGFEVLAFDVELLGLDLVEGG